MVGDTGSVVEKVAIAVEQVAAAQTGRATPADKGYHSNQTLVDVRAIGVRSYITSPSADPAGERRRPTRNVRSTAMATSCLRTAATI